MSKKIDMQQELELLREACKKCSNHDADVCFYCEHEIRYYEKEALDRKRKASQQKQCVEKEGT